MLQVSIQQPATHKAGPRHAVALGTTMVPHGQGRARAGQGITTRIRLWQGPGLGQGPGLEPGPIHKCAYTPRSFFTPGQKIP